MKLLLFIIIGFIFYMINRGYRPENFQNIKLNTKQTLKGDLKDHEAGLLVSLMAKVAKADGKVCELEAQLLSHTFTDISSHFENSQSIREQLKEIYKKEIESFDNTLEICKKYLKLTKFDYAKRLGVMEYLLNLAFIDTDFSEAEFMIIEDISVSLNIKWPDTQRLIKQFEHFYANAKNNKLDNLEKAYAILGVTQNDDMSIIKKKYRILVKKNHPDIITGQGANQSIIDQATKKLQDINEAYELIKKHK
ncbi:DnaJ-like protein DjlA [hydrothermal vent metagenome]|uniref:DnaJ-like protein DjlA n=1 Tax=hydrothermal vent metagenome TaxID=652676 RepID=A0A3B1E634_9ZZZZ